jgi:hypothetical protein
MFLLDIKFNVIILLYPTINIQLKLFLQKIKKDVFHRFFL